MRTMLGKSRWLARKIQLNSNTHKKQQTTNTTTKPTKHMSNNNNKPNNNINSNNNSINIWGDPSFLYTGATPH